MTNLRLRLRSFALGLATSLGAITLAPNDARACGGCFHPKEIDPQNPETTVVSAHRMAFSISPQRTVLWDQVQYAGSPVEFAWVLPVRAGAYVELASDAWFDALDAATSTRVTSPKITCAPVGGFFPGPDGSNGGWEDSGGGCGCGDDAISASGTATAAGSSSGSGSMPPPPPPVTVVHEGSVGPYETVTLHANIPNALPDWLTSHGFAIDASVQPIIDAYAAEGFDFIALRLAPDSQVRQMKPVRVVSPGAMPILPLRMVSAGTGPTVSLTLFVIGEGRWESQNFLNAFVDLANLTWDFSTQKSNYALLREQVFTDNSHRAWITPFAKRGALLSPLYNPTTGQDVQYAVGPNLHNSIAGFFVDQGIINGETSDSSCLSAMSTYAQSGDLVVDLCQNQGSGAGGAGGGAGGTGGSGGAGDNCGVAGPGEIDSREFACGPLDDMASALVGMHPADVWVTRLESQLAHAALDADFILQAEPTQAETENWLTGTPVNPPCTPATTTGIPTDTERAIRKARTEMAWIAAALLAAAAALARRSRRAWMSLPAPRSPRYAR